MGMNSPLIQQAMENELPKIDLPEDLITGRLTDTMILNLYAHFPCRIKAEIFVLCRKGEVDASINLKHYYVGDNCFLILLPGTVFQINRIEGDVDIYFGGVSSDFLRSVQPIKSVIDVSYAIKRNPCVVLRPEAIEMAQSYFETVHKSKEVFGAVSRDVLKHLYYSLMYMLNKLYKNRKVEKENLTQNERTAQDFGQLVLDNYTREKSVAFYAGKLSITPAYLSSVVKQVTGRTCTDIIADMVIMDAKAQLKSTNLPIYLIADSLNFENISFFGKYFKRYVGIGPQEYRNQKDEDCLP